MRRFIMMLMVLLVGGVIALGQVAWTHFKDNQSATAATFQSQATTHLDALLERKKRELFSLFQLQFQTIDIYELLLHVNESKTQREALFFRERLHERLLPAFKTLQVYGVKDLHLYVAEKQRFLMMSEPTLPLTKTPPSLLLDRLYTEHKNVSGFKLLQENLVWVALFPLMANGELLGAIEVIVNPSLITEEMKYLGWQDAAVTQSMQGLNENPLQVRIPLLDGETSSLLGTLVLTPKNAQSLESMLFWLFVGTGASLIIGLVIGLCFLIQSKKTQYAIYEKQKMAGAFVKNQRLLGTYHSFINMRMYWQQAIRTVLHQEISAVQKEEVPSLKLAQELFNDFVFAANEDEDTVKILPLFEPVWQVKLLYEELLNTAGITLEIENSTKTLVSMKLGLLMQALVSIILVFKKEMENKRKVPSTIEIRLFDKDASVCVELSGKGISLGEVYKGQSLIALIVEREHRGIVRSVCQENDHIFTLCFPAVQQVR